MKPSSENIKEEEKPDSDALLLLPPGAHENAPIPRQKPSVFIRTLEGDIVHFPASSHQDARRAQPIAIPRKYVLLHKTPIPLQKFEIVKPQCTAPRSLLFQPTKSGKIMNIRENFDNFKPQKWESPKYTPKPRKPTMHRTCSLCSLLVPHASVKNTTIESERLIILWAGTVSTLLLESTASEIMENGKKKYFCTSHFSEAAGELLRALRVSSPDEIPRCEVGVVEELATEMARIKRIEMTGEMFGRMLFRFAGKYWNPFEYFNGIVPKTEEIDEFLESPDPLETEIVPKSHRQPRKQVFEKEEHESTVKLIEQLDFRLPRWQPPTGSPSNFQEVCRYCSEHNERSRMVRVPRGELLLLRWLDGLGAEFGERLRSEEENYVCRAHFEKEAFGRRGKLLKGGRPSVKTQKVAVTYRIQGEHFLKLAEERSGRFGLEHWSNAALWSFGEGGANGDFLNNYGITIFETVKKFFSIVQNSMYSNI